MSNMIDTNEKEALYDKVYECPVCKGQIKAKIVKTGKCKLESTDEDLRPVYQNIDSLKYDAIFCNGCGYASLKKFFDEPMVPVQIKYIKEKISSHYSGGSREPDVYTYEEAIKRHKMALLSSMVKNAKISEQAYTALKTAWLYRGWHEKLEEASTEKESLVQAEKEFINKAYYGFNQAYINEEFPICGMDEMTFYYLLASLCAKTEHYEEAKRWVSMVVSSREASPRVKEKARDLKDRIVEATGEE